MMVKRLGCWLTTGFVRGTYNAEAFTNSYFFKRPYFAFVEFIIDLGTAILGDGAWIKSVADRCAAYPAIEISVMVAFDMANETYWGYLATFLNSVQNTNVKFVGIDGEHATYGKDFNVDPNYSLGRLWRNGQITEAKLIELFDRFKGEVEPRGFSFVSYYLKYGSDVFKNRYKEIGHTNYPCYHLTGGDHEGTLDWFTESKYIGISCGLAERHPFPHDNHHCQATINTIIEHGVAFSDEVRHCINWALGDRATAEGGGSLDRFTGDSGIWTSQIWDHPQFKQWVWEKQQQYPGIFITSIETPPTGNLEVNVQGIKPDTEVRVTLRG